MGAHQSLADQYIIVKDLNFLIKIATDKSRGSLLTLFTNLLNKLNQKADKFFTTYDELLRNDKLGGEGIEINLYFTQIDNAAKAFIECVKYIQSNSKGEEIPQMTANFRNDFRRFINQITQLATTVTQVLLLINSKPSPSLMSLFYIELSLFNYALNIRQINRPPFYTMSTSSTYELRDDIHETMNRYIEIIAPHCSGKTSLVPIHLVCRSLEKFPKGRFIVVIEPNTENIQWVKNVYNRILSIDKDLIIKAENRLNDEDEPDDIEVDSDDPTAQVTISLNDFIDFIDCPPPCFPVIAILSPNDTLRLIHRVPKLDKFIQKSTFVFDDIHKRTAATDVLVQDVVRAIGRAKSPQNDLRLVLMSTVHDNPILNCLGRHKELTIKNVNVEVQKKEIICSSISDIRNRKLFKEMHEFFDNWIEESSIIVGSVIVFVPSEKVGQRLYKEIFKYYSRDNSIAVCPLTTKIKKNEEPDQFYARLLADLQIARNDRAADREGDDGKEILFLMPMDVTGRISKEELALINSSLPIPLINNVSRIFITTVKNESLMHINDLMVIFDTGIEEVEFYDPVQCAIHVREQQLPKPFMEQHHKMLGSCGDGYYYEFSIRNSERPNSLIPYVKRSDLGKDILILRNLNIKLEKQANLPNEPDHKLLDNCFSVLIDIGLINNSDKELTDIGKVAAKFSSVSPFFALATAKFTQNHTFAFLCSLVIENARTLIINPQSKLLSKHFCRDSDVVTLIEAVCDLSERADLESDEIGLSIGMIYSIYNMISTTFDNCNGREAVINSVKWARSQPGGTFQMVDQFVRNLPKEQFLDKRKATFIHVLGAGPGSEPTLVYKAPDSFKFSSSSSEESAEDFAKIKFAKRPGWLGLQSPGDIFVLSLIVEEENEINRGLIIHRDLITGTDNPGVVSFLVDNPSLNSFFFVSLFQAYWCDHNTTNEFIGIYHTPVVKKESAFLIHMTNNDDKTYLNYCPRNTAIENTMRNAIPQLSSLMPFVPRSIIAKIDVPLCAIEIFAYGTSRNYTTNVHLVTEGDADYPFAYPINKETLQYASNNINELKKSMSLIRFAITGESFYFKLIHGREVEAELSYPDVNPAIRSVFDPYHSSHMVLLVDKNYPNKPPIPPLAWLPTGAVAAADEGTDTEDKNDLIQVASKMMSSFGYAERSADLFFVTLGGGFPKALEGEVPEFIRGRVGFSTADGGIRFGMNSLVKHFVREFTRKQKLDDPIPLEILGSTDAWRNYPHDEDACMNICNQISNIVKDHFHVKEVQTAFFGTSMIGIRIDGLPEDLVCHKISNETWNDEYQPCRADYDIMNILRNFRTIDLQVTQVVHEPTISMSVRHMRRFALSEEEFQNKVDAVSQKFGFLKASSSEYVPALSADLIGMGVIGEIDVELIGIASGIAFASLIEKEFPSRINEEDFLTSTMATCKGMATINPHLGAAPSPLIGQRAVKVSPSEIDALKQQIASNVQGNKRKKWKLYSDFNVLIIPANEEAALREMMRNIRNKDEDTTCLLMCDPPQQFLPQSLYVYQEDGSTKTFSICKQCMIEAFRSEECFQSIIDPLTHIVDRTKLESLNDNLPGFPLVDDGVEVNGVVWPQIPIGQAVWALMSDPDVLGMNVKSWFTAVIDFVIRMARNYFTYCPNHPNIPQRVPKPGCGFQCPYCNYKYCEYCRTWHSNDRCPGLAFLDAYKRCPACQTPTIKNGGCNHITCRCGKHWCYKCDKSPIFNDAGACYNHLNAVHGGHST